MSEKPPEIVISNRKYPPEIHEKHHDYIALLIEKEGQRTIFRNAIITKTFAGLLWAFIIFLCSAIWSYLKVLLK